MLYVFSLINNPSQRCSTLFKKYFRPREREFGLGGVCCALLEMDLLTLPPSHFPCRRFVRGLALLHNDFRGHMMSANRAHEKQVISEEMLRVILSNIGSLYTINTGLLAELEERFANWYVLYV